MLRAEPLESSPALRLMPITQQVLAGLDIDVDIDDDGQEVNATVDENKAMRWTSLLAVVIDTGMFHAEVAACFPERFGSACMLATGNIGWAFVRPFFVQDNAPLPGFAIPPLLHSAAKWWLSYLALGPTVNMRVNDTVRDTVWTWTDSSGEAAWCGHLRQWKMVVHSRDL